MRKDFNEFEQKIIDKIIELDKENKDVVVINILNDKSKLLGKCTFDWCIKNENVELFCTQELKMSASEDVDFIKEIQRKLYDFILLMEYLEQEKYIALIDSNEINYSVTSDLIQNIPLDSFISKKMVAILNKKLKPLHNLFLLKKHKYLDLSRYAENLRDLWYRWLTSITIIVSLVGTITTITCTSNVNVKNPICVEIKETQPVINIKNESITETKTINIQQQDYEIEDTNNLNDK